MFAEGVTVITADTGLLPVLIAVKAGTLPEPLAAKPIEVVLFVQAKVVPPVPEVKFEAGMLVPLQTVVLTGTVTEGVGFTVIVYVETVPVQLFAVAVIETIAVTGLDPALIAVKGGISPVPLAARPMDGLEFVHVKVAPDVGLVSGVPATAIPLHNEIFAGTLTTGDGFTVIVYVEGIPLQFATEGVTVIVATTGAVPVLIALKEGMLPLPPAPMPMEGLLLVQVNDPPAGTLEKLVAATVLVLQTVISAGTSAVGVGLTVMV